MGKKNFLDRLFPPKYDFYAMLREQAEVTAQGIKTLLDWLEDSSDNNFDLVLQLTAQADIVRMDMEEKLIEAFSTPFARQDIYYISVIMDRIIEYARTAMQAIKEYEVKPDCFIINMVRELSEATFMFERAVALLESDPIHARGKIQAIRKAQAAVDEHYRKGMSEIFKTSDVMRAIKYHEINCHLREAAIYLGSTVDILHRIVVRLA